MLVVCEQEFDVDNRWGKVALDRMYQEITGFVEPMPNIEVRSFCAACYVSRFSAWPSH